MLQLHVVHPLQQKGRRHMEYMGEIIPHVQQPVMVVVQEHQP